MNFNEKFVITLSREIGSGGHTVGAKLAEALGVPYYDKNLIRGLVEEFNLSAYNIEKIKGEKKSWVADFIQKISPVPTADVMLDTDSRHALDYRSKVTTDDIYQVESRIIHDLAEESSCVLAGRSGFFILKDHPNKADIFITASREHRIARVVQKQGYTEEQAAAIIDSVDEMRDNYVRRYTQTSRNDARNYDLALRMDHLTEDEAVACILQFLGFRAE